MESILFMPIINLYLLKVENVVAREIDILQKKIISMSNLRIDVSHIIVISYNKWILMYYCVHAIH